MESRIGKPLEGSTTSGNESTRWKLSEKRALLESIQKHGLANLQRIAKDVKTRSESEIKFFLNNRRRLLGYAYAQHMKTASQTHGSPLQNEHIIKWSMKMKEAVEMTHRGKDYSVVLTEILEAAGKEERGKKPVSDDEPNFSVLYSYLAQVLSGCIPPSLSPTESWLMLHAWRSLSDTIKKHDWSQEKEFLENLHLRETVPLDPIYRRLTREGLWKAANDLMKQPENILPNNGNAAASSSNGVLAKEEVVSDLEECTNPSKYPLYDLNEHSYGHLLSSLNPLTVPVSMLEKETKIVFGTEQSS